MPFGIEKLLWLGYSMVTKNFEDVFVRFDRINERDGQTHRRTDRHRMTANTALDGRTSRGKN